MLHIYQTMILRVLFMMKRPDVNPLHVEAYMRLEHGTLDNLSAARFAREVRTAVDTVDEAGIDDADDLARSYGLLPPNLVETVECHHCNRPVPDRAPPAVTDEEAWEAESQFHEPSCHELLTRGGQRRNPLTEGEIYFSGHLQPMRACHAR